MAAASSSPFFGIREEDHSQMKQQQQEQQQQQQQQHQQFSHSNPSAAAHGGPQPAAPPVKKKRNLPGNPNPDAEVIALSPKSLMATNRFICEVCNKGFQREQNLQLHRRGHNLPWKLKQKSTKEVRRRVYLCPEPTCVHHDPSRALGDLTGIKKHFSRKHGEKKWKCDKCSKRYAVQSDWKAHSKTCGTREYRCDCGTLFSRRDSFITHRAFCDALAQESARLPTSLTTLGGHLYVNNSVGMGLSALQDHHQATAHPSANLLRLGAAAGPGPAHFDHYHSLLSPSSTTTTTNPSSSSSSSFRHPSSAFFLPNSSQDFASHEDFQTKPFHHAAAGGGLMHLPDNSPAVSTAAANLFNLGFFSNGDNGAMHEQPNEQATLFAGNMMNDHHHHLSSAGIYGHESADHHLPQMSATALLQKAAQMGATTSVMRGFGSSSSSSAARNIGTQMAAESETHLHDLMNSLANGGTGVFGGGQQEAMAGAFGGFSAGLCDVDLDAKFQRHHQHRNADGLTRDFLGVGSMQVRGIGGGMDSMGPLDTEMKSAAPPSASARSFAGGGMQQ